MYRYRSSTIDAPVGNSGTETNLIRLPLFRVGSSKCLVLTAAPWCFLRSSLSIDGDKNKGYDNEPPGSGGVKILAFARMLRSLVLLSICDFTKSATGRVKQNRSNAQRINAFES